MQLPNPIGTKVGRLFAFFMLYLTEGIPYGFATLALFTQLARVGYSKDELGYFAGMILLPWSFKWIMGPFVDLISFGRIGHRKAWILFSQILMCATLLCCIPITASVFNRNAEYEKAKQLLPKAKVEQTVNDTADDASKKVTTDSSKRTGSESSDSSEPGLSTPAGRLEKEYSDGLAWGLTLLIVVFFIHNWFAATQDVAIDAMAVNVLKPDERGLANGMMFAGAYMGQAVGGSLVLMLIDGVPWLDGLRIPFQYSYWFVSGGILFVTVFVVLPLREKSGVIAADRVDDQAKPGIGSEIKSYSKTAVTAVFANRNGMIALGMAVLPAGALALSKELQGLLAVDLGLSNGEIGRLTLLATVLSAVGCVVGGLISDRLGRRPILVVYIVMSSIPTLWLAFHMQSVGWNGKLSTPDSALPSIIYVFWIAVTVHSLFLGLIYGTKFAVFMDIVNPAVAGTQFTAYMALGNVVLSYTAVWQGYVIEEYGYTRVLFIDCGVSLLFLCLLPFLIPVVQPPDGAETDELPSLNGRASGN